MDTRFDHGREPDIYAQWEQEGYFSPEGCIKRGVARADAPVFSIVLPPPNVTGELHMGHAAMLAIEDTIIRYHRMRGDRTLWIPGTDHAAIATQSRVEKDIYKETGKSRSALGREEFLKRVEAFAAASHDTIVKQIRALGASLDWSREAYTLDEKRSVAVRTAFKRMYDDGLIYRGARIVNWDPKLQTTVSDDEIEWEEEHAPLYYLTYGPFTIATARPETKFGDKYVVMHPDDARYAQYKDGDAFEAEWINGKVTATVVKDIAIDPTFGTGVMTITPAHDATDFDIAERHGLDTEQIIDRDGRLLPIAGEFAGKSIAAARGDIVEKLKQKGLVVKIDEAYLHRIAVNGRGGGIIEPQIMEQWFVDVDKNVDGKSLKDRMREAVANGNVKILPERFEGVYFHWIDNLHDWCISRQLWFGHRIPVWYRENETYVGVEEPEGKGWNRDPDTLDTWFSSGLWTFSTLGWPEATNDLKTYHPTALLETGYDILFFWVARMILMSTYLLGDIPFRTVYLHGIVRDAKGRKMSKSLGNGIDPLEMVGTYGADATRLAFVIGVGPGSDMNMSEDKIRAYRNFGTKIWNVGRFLEMNRTSDGDAQSEPVDERNILDEFDGVKRAVTAHLDSYELHLAAERAYDYFWNRFANGLLEEMKPQLKAGSASHLRLLTAVFRDCLKLLHPFMPFTTEAVWQELSPGHGMLIGERW